jgi:queuosine biosynthesis protein QueC
MSTPCVMAMTAFNVDVVDGGRSPRTNWHACVIDHHIRFATAGLESYCFAVSNPIVYDLLLAAAAIEFCDRSCPRPQYGWGRTFASLHAALEVLTGDRWSLSFRPRVHPVEAPAQSSLQFPVNVAAVMPYSDGLDSRAVAIIMSRALDGELVRVRLGPTRDPACAGRRKPFARVPYRVSPPSRSQESSGRSRAFRFTALAGIAASLTGAQRVIMSESLQGALGPVLVPVAHAYEDYRNHPLFTNRMAAFLSALLENRVAFEYPRLWHTKAETLLEALKVAKPADLTSTRSCWQQSRQVSINGRRRHCGMCAACLLRRMSLTAAGAPEEPTATVSSMMRSRRRSWRQARLRMRACARVAASPSSRVSAVGPETRSSKTSRASASREASVSRRSRCQSLIAASTSVAR